MFHIPLSLDILDTTCTTHLYLCLSSRPLACLRACALAWDYLSPVACAAAPRLVWMCPVLSCAGEEEEEAASSLALGGGREVEAYLRYPTNALESQVSKESCSFDIEYQKTAFSNMSCLGLLLQRLLQVLQVLRERLA